MRARYAPLHRREPNRRLAAVFAAVSMTSLLMVGAMVSTPSSVADSAAAFTQTKSMSRVHLINGQDQVADTRNVTVTADRTTNLRADEGVNITWSGAHPTGGVHYNVNLPVAADDEYPVVILQCRGVDSPDAAAAARLSPRSCFTATPDQRDWYDLNNAFPANRLDRYAAAADRKQNVGLPPTIPDACKGYYFLSQRYVPFDAIDGTAYYPGIQGCTPLAPEQSLVPSPLNPPNDTYGITDAQGKGSARFIVQDSSSNASLGCSDVVACSIVVIPIMGVSCDAAAASLPAADRPTDVATAQSNCTTNGAYPVGALASSQTSYDTSLRLAVSGHLWWSESNWRNRITIPITFAQTNAACDGIGGKAPQSIYGSEYMLQATLQWSPKLCADKAATPIQHVQQWDVLAKRTLANGILGNAYVDVKAVFQGAPPATRFRNPVVQAPTAITGFAIGYTIDDWQHHEYTQLQLTPRLLAKLLTQSYGVASARAKAYNAPDFAHNPGSIIADPEFLALNPGVVGYKTINGKQVKISNIDWPANAPEVLFAMSAESDVMTAVTSYINADPDARAWLDGTPDPWGMVVNPKYAKIALPTALWPMLDDYVPTPDTTNPCEVNFPSPLLQRVAAPLANPAQLVRNLRLAITNSQVECANRDTPVNARWTSQGPQVPGGHFLLSLVSLGDAARFQLNTAALQTQAAPGAPAQFSDATGRAFVQPTQESMLAAARLFTPDDSLGTWTVPYDTLRTDARGAAAYPGTMLYSTDIPTYGLASSDAAAYANFLRFVAGPAQTSGTTVGTLPAGYVPMTKANGLDRMVQYTLASAQAVELQTGKVPVPSTAVPTSTATAAPRPTHKASSAAPAPRPVVTDAVEAPAAAGFGVPVAGPAASAPPSAAPLRASASATVTERAVRTGVTAALPLGWSAYVVPVLIGIAVLSGAASAVAAGVGRRA